MQIWRKFDFRIFLLFLGTPGGIKIVYPKIFHKKDAAHIMQHLYRIKTNKWFHQLSLPRIHRNWNMYAHYAWWQNYWYYCNQCPFHLFIPQTNLIYLPPFVKINVQPQGFWCASDSHYCKYYDVFIHILPIFFVTVRCYYGTCFGDMVLGVASRQSLFHIQVLRCF